MPRRNYTQTLYFVFVDILASTSCIVAAYFTRLLIEDPFRLVSLHHGISLYLLNKSWIFLIILVGVAYYGGYRIIITVWDEVRILWRGLFVSFLIVWVILSLQKEAETVSRIVITLSFAYMMVVLPFARSGLRFILYRILYERKPAFLFERRRGERKNSLKDALNKEWYGGYVIVDTVHADSLGSKIDTCFVPMECTDEDTMKFLKEHVGDMIIVSALSGLSFMNTEVRTFLTGNIALITTNNGLLSIGGMFLKRLFDIFLSGIALIGFLPFVLIIPVIIKLDSKGPIFFLHERCGMRLEPFKMVKYRTMLVESDEIMEQHLRESPEAHIDLKERNKILDDPRITRVGKVLRKTSLDELPQLFNVIRGEMSVVGPRPDTKKALEGFLGEYEYIYRKVRPGITGLWQVSGRSDIKYHERVKLDYSYVLNWSIWLDLVIILKTIRAAFSGKGAY
jgi:exopolysaccharide biosynthesis polyprenyl glycosylphosphotransferase